MHIKELTNRILDLGIVNSSCTTSLETLLYRQTSKGNSKFVRVAGKMGWFGLKGEVEEDAVEKFGGGLLSETVPGLEADEGGVELEGQLMIRKRSHQMSGSEDLNSCSSETDSSSSSSADGGSSELVYHKKYNFISKLARGIIYESAALCDKLKGMEDEVKKAEAEKSFLLKKLAQVEKQGHMMSSVPSKMVKRSLPSPTPPSLPLSPQQQHKSKPVPQLLVTRGQTINVPDFSFFVDSEDAAEQSAQAQPSSEADVSDMPHSVILSKAMDHLSPPTAAIMDASLDADVSSEPSVSPLESEAGEEEAPVHHVPARVGGAAKKGGVRGGGDGAGAGRSKRRVRRLHPIPVRGDGTPVFPIQIGGLTVHSLGKIVYDRPAYHTERYILPVGFESSRLYPSMKDPSKKCRYTCRILDGGDTPIFEMVSDDGPQTVRANSSTACQSIVLKAINKARDKQATNSGSGPEFFGYSNPTILNLIQDMDGAESCAKFKRCKFQEARKPVKGAGKGKKPSRRKEVERVAPVQQTFRQKEANTLLTDPSLAPVFESKLFNQYNIQSFSSDEWSSESEHGLVIDG